MDYKVPCRVENLKQQQYANENNARYLCFDYRGHGNSSSSFVDCTMHDWMLQ